MKGNKIVYDYVENSDEEFDKTNSHPKNENKMNTIDTKGGILNYYTYTKDKEVVDRYGKNFVDFITKGTCNELPMFTSPPNPVGVKRLTLDKSITIQPGDTTYLYIKPFAPVNMQLEVGTTTQALFNIQEVQPFVNFQVVCARVVLKQVGIMALNDGYGTAIDAVMCGAGLSQEYLKESLLSLQTPPGRKMYLVDGREGITANFIGSPLYPKLYNSALAFEPNLISGGTFGADLFLPSETMTVPLENDNSFLRLTFEDGQEEKPVDLQCRTYPKAITRAKGRWAFGIPTGDALFVRISPPSIMISYKIYVDCVVQGPLKPSYLSNMPQYIPRNVFDFARLKYALENLYPMVYNSNLYEAKMYALDNPIHLNKEEPKEEDKYMHALDNPIHLNEDLDKIHIDNDYLKTLKDIRKEMDVPDLEDIYGLNQEKYNKKEKMIEEKFEDLKDQLNKKFELEKEKCWDLVLKMKRERLDKLEKKNSKKKNQRKLKGIAKKKHIQKEEIDNCSIEPKIDPKDFEFIEEFNYEIPKTPINPYPFDKINEKEDQEESDEPDFSKYCYAMNKAKKGFKKAEEMKEKRKDKYKDDEKIEAKQIKRKFEVKGTSNIKNNANLPDYIKEALEFTGMDITNCSSTQENSRLFRDGSTPMPYCDYQFFPMVSDNNKITPGIVAVKMEKDAKDVYKIKMEVDTLDGPKMKTVRFYYNKGDFAKVDEFIKTLEEVINFLYSTNSHYCSDEGMTIRFFSPKPIASTSYMYALTLAMCGAPSGGYYTGSYGFKEDSYICSKMEKEVVQMKSESTNINCPLVVLSSDLEDGAFLNIVSGIVPKFYDGKMVPTNSPKIGLIYGLLPFSIRMYKETPIKYLQAEAKNLLTSKDSDWYRKAIVLENLKDPERLARFVKTGEMTWKDFARSSLTRFTGIYKKKKNYITANDFYAKYPELLERDQVWSFTWDENLFVDSAMFAKHVKEKNPQIIDMLEDDTLQDWKDALYSVRELTEEEYLDQLGKKKKELKNMDYDYLNNIKKVTFRNDDDLSGTFTKAWKELKEITVPFFKLLKGTKEFVQKNSEFGAPKTKIYTTNDQAQVLGQLNLPKECDISAKPYNNSKVSLLMKTIDALTPQGALIVGFASGWPEVKNIPVVDNDTLLKLIERYRSLKIQDDPDIDEDGRVIPEDLRVKGMKRNRSLEKKEDKKEEEIKPKSKTKKKKTVKRKFKKKGKKDSSSEEEEDESDDESDSIDVSEVEKYNSSEED